jgi:xyloglucan-specific exo-beta-1,4-glucanase
MVDRAGAPRSGSTTLTLYLGAQLTSQSGQLFRSTDNGASWVRIDDAAHEYGYTDTIQADPRIFGRVYLGTGGRGIVYGDSPN